MQHRKSLNSAVFLNTVVVVSCRVLQEVWQHHISQKNMNKMFVLFIA